VRSAAEGPDLVGETLVVVNRQYDALPAAARCFAMPPPMAPPAPVTRETVPSSGVSDTIAQAEKPAK